MTAIAVIDAQKKEKEYAEMSLMSEKE